MHGHHYAITFVAIYTHAHHYYYSYDENGLHFGPLQYIKMIEFSFKSENLFDYQQTCIQDRRLEEEKKEEKKPFIRMTTS